MAGLRPSDSRRRVLVLAAAAAAMPPALADWASRSVAAAEPLRQICPGGPSGLLAIGASGALWALSLAGAAPQKLAAGLDPESPLASGHGRIAARHADGGLWLWERGQAQRGRDVVLAPQAGLLILPLAVVGVAVESQASAQRLVRMEPEGGRGWSVVARSTDAVLPDARPLQADLDARGDGGHLVVLAGPDGGRYDHGALGDGIEATRLLWLERHRLQVMRELSLPTPHVFEDIAPRAVALAKGIGLLTVRSGPMGSQLALVTADPTQANRLQVAALGDALGTRHRWLAPTTDGLRLLAVHTPHIGGVLHEYRLAGDRLASRIVARDLSTHRLGSRELDLAVWLGPRLVVPSQNGMRLRVLDASSGWGETDSAALPARLAMTAALPDARGLAALLDDGSVTSVGMR